MELWSNGTCLNFVQRTTEEDYIYFKHDANGCWSYRGRWGGHQDISLGHGCRGVRTVAHKIGHALGLWHGHQRPDRDSYIAFHWNDPESNRRDPRTVNEKYIDYQGTGYDYGSVMHSRNRNCADCYTLSVTNETEYERQGRPTLGWAPGPSHTDLIRISRLYNCPAPGQQGLLMFYIRYGHNIQTNWCAYVKLEAATSTGEKYTNYQQWDPQWKANME